MGGAPPQLPDVRSRAGHLNPLRSKPATPRDSPVPPAGTGRDGTRDGGERRRVGAANSPQMRPELRDALAKPSAWPRLSCSQQRQTPSEAKWMLNALKPAPKSSLLLSPLE